MAITIRDIAKTAGVSPSTVSKVINDHPKIPQSTKERIRQIMKDLNYYPNQIAKNFAQQSSYTLGVVLPIQKAYAFTNPYIYEILGGIEQVASDNGYLVTLVKASSPLELKKSLEQLIFQKRLDGLIINVSLINQTIINKLNALNYPFTVIGQPEDCTDVCWIDIDNLVGGEIAAKHLYDMHYKRPAFLGYNHPSDNIAAKRLAGYEKVLKEKSTSLSKDYVLLINEENRDIYAITKKLLQLKSPPDSLICSSSHFAFEAIKAVKASGLSIPKDFGVISFDRYPLSLYTDPVLSVVDLDVFEIGLHTALTLINRIKNPSAPMQYTLLTPTLLPNPSTKKPN